MERCPSVRKIETQTTVDGELAETRMQQSRCIVMADHGGCHIFAADVPSSDEAVTRWEQVR